MDGSCTLDYIKVFITHINEEMKYTKKYLQATTTTPIPPTPSHLVPSLTLPANAVLRVSVTERQTPWCIGDGRLHMVIHTGRSCSLFLTLYWSFPLAAPLAPVCLIVSRSLLTTCLPVSLNGCQSMSSFLPVCQLIVYIRREEGTWRTRRKKSRREGWLSFCVCVRRNIQIVS